MISKVMTAIFYPYLILYPELYHSIDTPLMSVDFDMKKVVELLDFHLLIATGSEVQDPFCKELIPQGDDNEGNTLVILASNHDTLTYNDWFSLHSSNCLTKSEFNDFQEFKFNRDISRPEFAGKFFEIIKKAILNYCKEKTALCETYFDMYPKPKVYVLPEIPSNQ